MTLNCIRVKQQFWKSMEYFFIAITLSFTLIQRDSICEGSIYESNGSVKKLFLFNGNEQQKKILRNNNTKNINVQWLQFPNIYVWNKPRQVDMPLKLIPALLAWGLYNTTTAPL